MRGKARFGLWQRGPILQNARGSVCSSRTCQREKSLSQGLAQVRASFCILIRMTQHRLLPSSAVAGSALASTAPWPNHPQRGCRKLILWSLEKHCGLQVSSARLSTLCGPMACVASMASKAATREFWSQTRGCSARMLSLLQRPAC